MAEIKAGSLITLEYEGRNFRAIVIDPNGLGNGQPSVGFGYRMAADHAGLPESTARSWVREESGIETLEAPSGKAFRVRELLGSDGNSYKVLEASEWLELAVDLLVNPGQTGKSKGKGSQQERANASKALRARLGDFILWFSVKGFYAETYVALKGVYTEKDSRATTQWLEARYLGIPVRKLYTDLLQSKGCQSFDYGNWTNHIYQGLFGMPAKQMKEAWALIDGNKQIARNYIPEAVGLDAVRYCEDMTVRTFVDNLKEAHDLAIDLTKRKYLADWEN